MNTQDFCFILKQNSHLLREGCFGLEKENVRVNQDGTLALTPHPAVFGDKCRRGLGIYGNAARCGYGEYRR